MKRFYYIILCLTALVLASCEGGYIAIKSSVAQLTAFTFAKNDSMPGLAAAKFSVQELLDTGLVTTGRDSIAYGTSLERVVPRFVFAATPSAAFLTLPDTTCILTGYDTLDFTKQPIYLTVRSQDGVNTKVYQIVPTVHQMDPDLYEWTMLTPSVYPADESEQQVVELGDDFVLLRNNGYSLRVYGSEDGIEWIDLGAPAGLPVNAMVRQIISDGTTLYYGEGTTLYTSTDAQTWTAKTVDYPVVTMLLYWNTRVWALVDNNGYELAYCQNDGLALSGLRPQGLFPASDFAAVAFLSTSQRQRAMIVGGFAEDGQPLNTSWNLEYTPHPLPYGSYRLEEFSADRPSFQSMTGASLVWYNNQLMLFGGIDPDRQYIGSDIMVSTDEGITWKVADTLKNRLPESYGVRQRQTAIVRDNNIYLFGGQDKTACYSDVYRGRLNSIDWEKKD